MSRSLKNPSAGRRTYPTLISQKPCQPRFLIASPTDGISVELYTLFTQYERLPMGVSICLFVTLRWVHESSTWEISNLIAVEKRILLHTSEIYAKSLEIKSFSERLIPISSPSSSNTTSCTFALRIPNSSCIRCYRVRRVRRIPREGLVSSKVRLENATALGTVIMTQ